MRPSPPAHSPGDAAAAAGSISACLLDGRGGARELAAEAIRAWQPEQGVLWVTGATNAVGAWLGALPNANPGDVGLFTQQPDQPWAEFVWPDVVVVVIALPEQKTRDPAAPEWTVAFHLWASPRLLVTAGTAPVIGEVWGALAQERGPRDAADFVVALSERAEDRLRAMMHVQDVRVAAAEKAFAEERPGAFDEVVGLRQTLLEMRRRSAALRVIRDRLRSDEVTWLASSRGRWHKLERQALDDHAQLEALLDRVQGLQDLHAQHAADRTNRVLYVVTLFTAIFAPLGFVAGVFGMNVGTGRGSVPGFSWPGWFFLVTVLLVVLGVVQLWFLRRLRPP
jgi:zinc transporter